jgi:hypothetical protein
MLSILLFNGLQEDIKKSFRDNQVPIVAVRVAPRHEISLISAIGNESHRRVVIKREDIKFDIQ